MNISFFLVYCVIYISLEFLPLAKQSILFSTIYRLYSLVGQNARRLHAASFRKGI